MRRGHVVGETNRTLMALNSVFDAIGDEQCFHARRDVFVGSSEAQLEVQSLVYEAVAGTGLRTDGLSYSGALRQLRVADGYTDDQAVGAVASFDLERVFVCDVGWVPIPLSDLWGMNGRERVDEFVRHQLLPPVEARERLAMCQVKHAHFDPRLRQRKVYAKFLRGLAESNLVDFALGSPVEKVGIFCVRKKQDRLRMIVDARRSNLYFKPASVRRT